jgi:hypothetical protein
LDIIHVKENTISFKYTTEKYTFRKVYAVGYNCLNGWTLLIYDGNFWTKNNFDLFETGIAGRSESSVYISKYVIFQSINYVF